MSVRKMDRVRSVRHRNALLQIRQLLYPEAVTGRPKTRGDCAGVARPCPYVACRHNLYLDINKTGNIRYTRLGLEPWDVDPEKSCALDIADKGGVTLEEIGEILDVTRERVRQIEAIALRKMDIEI